MRTQNSDFFSQRLTEELDKKPSLQSVFDAQDESAKIGFDFASTDEVVGKVKEEYNEMLEAYDARDKDFGHFREEVGDCFFALVNLCRHAGIDPEQLVRENADKYLKRCKYIEDILASEGKKWADLSKPEIYTLWKQAKKSGL